MKKIIFFLLLIVFLSGCNKSKEFNIENDFKIIVKKNKKCKSEFDLKKYYTNDNRNLYIVCIDNIELSNKNSSILLYDYLESGKHDLSYVIDRFIEKVEYSSSLYDGGTKIYQNKESTKNVKGGITLVVCNTLKGNRDVYIGNEDMDISYGFDKKSMCN